MNKQMILGGVGFLILAAVGAYAMYAQGYFVPSPPKSETPLSIMPFLNDTNTEPVTIIPVNTPNNLSGSVTLAIKQPGFFKNITIMPMELLGDSRCPIKVQCIQAGNVKVALSVTTGGRTSIVDISTGETINKDGFVIKFISTTPAKFADMQPADVDYRFTFSVAPETTATAPCYIGGCSSEICSDRNDAVSTCIYREEYVCYKSASCTRQTNGSCGWTQTPSLKACLLNPAPTL